MEPIVVEVPAAFKAAAQCFSRLCELAESARQAAAAGEPFAYAELERTFVLGAQVVQCDLHAVVISAMAFEDSRLNIDGVLHRRTVQATTTFYSLAGPVPVTRWLYRPLEKRDAPTVDPVALRIGTVAGTWTPGTASAMAFMVQQGPVREAAQLARQLGVLPYSAASFHRVTQALGERYEAHQNTIEDALIARHVVPAHATGIAFSLDRTAGSFEVPRRRGRGRPKERRKRPRKRKARGPIARVWKMIYCACWTLHDKDGRAIETVRYGCMPDDDAEYVAAALLSCDNYSGSSSPSVLGRRCQNRLNSRESKIDAGHAELQHAEGNPRDPRPLLGPQGPQGGRSLRVSAGDGPGDRDARGAVRRRGVDRPRTLRRLQGDMAPHLPHDADSAAA